MQQHPLNELEENQMDDDDYSEYYAELIEEKDQRAALQTMTLTKVSSVLHQEGKGQLRAKNFKGSSDFTNSEPDQPLSQGAIQIKSQPFSSQSEDKTVQNSNHVRQLYSTTESVHQPAVQKSDGQLDATIESQKKKKNHKRIYDLKSLPEGPIEDSSDSANYTDDEF